jgi:heme exporter protein B
VKTLLSATWSLLRKEIRVEMRTGEIVVTTALFATLVAVLTSLAFYIDARSAARVGPGVLWIAITFGGVLAMSRSWSRERDNDVFRALLMSPVPRAAIYFSKVLATLAFLGVIEVILLLEVTVLFNLDLGGKLLPLCILMAMGTFGFAVTGNLFAAFGVRTSARDMMLAVIVLPVVAPALLSGVVATRELIGGAPLGEIYGWMLVLGAFDLGFLAAGFALFETLLVE